MGIQNRRITRYLYIRDNLTNFYIFGNETLNLPLIQYSKSETKIQKFFKTTNYLKLVKTILAQK